MLRSPGPTRVRNTPAPGSSCTASKHGTWHAVDRAGCECPDAQQSKFRETKMRRLRIVGVAPPSRVDGATTRGQLRELAALGYPSSYLAAQLDVGVQRVTNLLGDGYEQVHRNTAAQIQELHAALRDTPARDNPDAVATSRSGQIGITEKHAADRGYQPPPREPVEQDAFDAPDAPERPTADTVLALLGWGAPDADVRQTYHEIPRADRPTVIADLTERGKTAAEIAALLDIEQRTVERHRATAQHGPPPQEETMTTATDTEHVACGVCEDVQDIPADAPAECRYADQDDHQAAEAAWQAGDARAEAVSQACELAASVPTEAEAHELSGDWANLMEPDEDDDYAADVAV